MYAAAGWRKCSKQRWIESLKVSDFTPQLRGGWTCNPYLHITPDVCLTTAWAHDALTCTWSQHAAPWRLINISVLEWHCSFMFGVRWSVKDVWFGFILVGFLIVKRYHLLIAARGEKKIKTHGVMWDNVKLTYLHCRYVKYSWEKIQHMDEHSYLM